MAGTPGPRGTGRGEPAARDRSRGGAVSFDRPRVLRVLARIIADLDELAGYPPIADEEQAKVEDPRPGVPATGDGWLEPDPPAKAVERSGKQ